jgi:hypothetical protein
LLPFGGRGDGLVGSQGEDLSSIFHRALACDSSTQGCNSPFSKLLSSWKERSADLLSSLLLAHELVKTDDRLSNRKRMQIENVIKLCLIIDVFSN